MAIGGIEQLRLTFAQPHASAEEAAVAIEIEAALTALERARALLAELG